jgi:hypothetical protein
MMQPAAFYIHEQLYFMQMTVQGKILTVQVVVNQF